MDRLCCFPNSPRRGRKSAFIGCRLFGYWLLVNTVPVVTQIRHGYRCTYLLPRVWVHGHPVVLVSKEHPVSIGPRVRG